MDWILWTIIGILVFLMWHVMTTPHPNATPPPVTIVVPARQELKELQHNKKPLEKAATIYAEPGLAGRIIDPLQNGPQNLFEDLAASSIASAY